MAGKDSLRLLFIAGGLSNGGAEKQFLYMLRALNDMNASFQVMTLTRGEFYENSLLSQGIQPKFAGSNSFDRFLNIMKEVRAFRPHFLQSSHFFSSSYAGVVGRITGVTSIGAVRSDLHRDLEGVGWPGPILLRLPDVLLANSQNARENAPKVGYPKERVHVIHNVINLDEFDRQQSSSPVHLLSPDNLYAITVARLVPVKRLERFLKALQLARRQVQNLVGVIVGDGPSAPDLHSLAEALDLEPNQPHGGIWFLGERNDVAQLLSQADLFVLTSDKEGFPNVVLEAMAASLPILTTPAGETPDLVVEGVNGYFIPYDDDRLLAERLVMLAQSPSLRKRLGNEGRRMVEQQFGYPRLKKNLIEVYHAIARQVNNQAVLSILDTNLTFEPLKVPTIHENRIR